MNKHMKTPLTYSS